MRVLQSKQLNQGSSVSEARRSLRARYEGQNLSTSATSNLPILRLLTLSKTENGNIAATFTKLNHFLFRFRYTYISRSSISFHVLVDTAEVLD
jgi:hypothetical protein